jgi:hypothetical protein
LECIEWGDQLQREAIDDERGPVYDDCQSNRDELHGHRVDERDDLLLRGISGEHGRGKRELERGECDPTVGSASSADESGSDCRKRTGGLELECLEWSDQLQRGTFDDERGTVYDDRQSDHDQFHRYGGDERHDVLLRGGGGQHGGDQCQL